MKVAAGTRSQRHEILPGTKTPLPQTDKGVSDLHLLRQSNRLCPQARILKKNIVKIVGLSPGHAHGGLAPP